MSTIESVAKSATDPESDFESVIESDSKSNSASDADYNSDPASQSESDFESEAESYSNSDPAFGVVRLLSMTEFVSAPLTYPVSEPIFAVDSEFRVRL